MAPSASMVPGERPGVRAGAGEPLRRLISWPGEKTPDADMSEAGGTWIADMSELGPAAWMAVLMSSGVISDGGRRGLDRLNGSAA